jgi:GTP-binding protein
MPTDSSDPVANYHAIRKELAEYSQALAEKEEVIVANKIDLDPDGARIEDLRRRLSPDIVPISAATGQGIRELTEILWQKVHTLKASAQVRMPVHPPEEA